MKYFLPLFFIAGLMFIFPQQLRAANALLVPVPSDVAQQQQFYVDVKIDPQGTSFNGVQGTVAFSSNTISFIRAETGSSNITYFIDQPTVKGDTLVFSGIIPGGFDGLINPFDPSHKKPGQVVRLVFAGKAAGTASISVSKMQITLNDGKGTLEPVPGQSLQFNVLDTVAPSTYSVNDVKLPLLSADIVSEKDLYDGKYSLIFNAVDKQSGIDHVEVKEGNGQWHTIQSPYLLQDQSRNSILLIRAVDMAGNTTLVTINPVSHTPGAAAVPLLLGLLALCIIFYVIKKKHTSA